MTRRGARDFCRAASFALIAGAAVRVFAFWDEPSTPGLALAFTIAAAILAFLGGTIGGSLVYDYGFYVETGGDHPVWHRSEADVFPGGATHGKVLGTDGADDPTACHQPPATSHQPPARRDSGGALSRAVVLLTRSWSWS